MTVRHTQALFKERVRTAGEAPDEQLDFIDESDDAVVVFEREDGSLYWVVGRVEYINLAKADINLRSISDACLQRLEKDPVQRVSIDDPRAIFVFRFYVEVDKHGKDLPGYQHPHCHAYRPHIRQQR